MKTQATRPRESRRLLAAGLPIALAAACLAGVITGCGGKEHSTKPPPPPIVEGWTAFEADSLAVALRKFEAAIALDPQNGAAYAGRGWVELTQATTMEAFRAAASSFDAAVQYGQTGAEVYGGRAAARLALGGGDLVGAIQDAQIALATSPNFVFEHRNSFDVRDLHLIAAFAEAGRGEAFTEARDHADQVLASGIRPGDPQTWTVDGVGYTTFETAVLAWLSVLSAAFAG